MTRHTDPRFALHEPTTFFRGIRLWAGLGGVCRLRRVQSSAGVFWVVGNDFHRFHGTGIIYIPKFTNNNQPNVGEFTIHGWLAKMGFARALAVSFREGRYLIIIEHQGIQIYIWQRINELPSLKLTFSHLKISGWKMKFPFGMNYFRGYVKLPGSTAVFFEL